MKGILANAQNVGSSHSIDHAGDLSTLHANLATREAGKPLSIGSHTNQQTHENLHTAQSGRSYPIPTNPTPTNKYGHEPEPTMGHFLN